MLNLRAITVSIIGASLFIFSHQSYAIPMVYTFESSPDNASIQAYVDGLTTEQVVDLIGVDLSAHATWQFVIDNELNSEGSYDVSYLSGAFFGSNDSSYDNCASSVPVQQGYIICSGDGQFFNGGAMYSTIKIGYGYPRPELAAWTVGMDPVLGFNQIWAPGGDSIWLEWRFSLSDISPVPEASTSLILVAGLLGLSALRRRRLNSVYR